MRISDGERLIGVMLAEVMQALKLDNEINPSLVKSLLCSGDDWAIKRAYPGIFDSQAPSDAVIKETGDILWMWGILEHRIEGLTGQEAADAANWSYTKFHGFDGNNDDHYGVARTMIDELDEFSDFKGRGLNSHSQASLPRYLTMYAKFDRHLSATHGQLGFDELKDICN